MAPLFGQHIVLVGCGSIGGYLARALVQFGAGFEGGRLVLIDPDLMDGTNVGRHVLGADSVGKTKVGACKIEFETQFPGVKILARASTVQANRALLPPAGVLINATGEQGIGDLINEWMLAAQDAQSPFPVVMHAWIEGNGAAAQTYYASDTAFGCFRCLQPDYGQRGRFSPLKDFQEHELLGGCGETPFTPYGPSAPMAAASLAAQHVADWANGKPRALLRTATIDWDRTNLVKLANPPASSHCPACNRSNSIT